MRPKDLLKALAFIRKEYQGALTYRYSFLSGIAFALIALLLYFTMADVFKAAIIPAQIPYGGDVPAFQITGAVLWQVVSFGLTSLSSSLTAEMFRGTFEMVYLSRTNVLSAIIGVSIFSMARNTLLAFASVILASWFFSIAFHFENVLLALLILALTYLSMLGIGMMIAGITMVTKSAGRIISIFTMVMSLLSGVFIPIELLPQWVRSLSSFIPVTYALDGLRSVLLLGAGLSDVSGTLWILLGISLILLPLGHHVFFHCVGIARKQGSMGQF